MILQQKDKKLFVSTFLLVVIDLVGLAGMLSPYQDLFLKITPINLLSSALLLFFNHKQFNKAFFIFCGITFLFGFFIEVIGVRTGIIFGQYAYGNTLGPKIAGAPILIGLNWLMLIYSAGIISHKLNGGMFFKSCTGAMLLVILDLFMEPVATRSDFWSWNNGILPTQNYVAWFITSFLLLVVFHKLQFNKINKFAPILYIVQLIFFALLSALWVKLDITHYTYFLLIIFTIFYPLLKSFENKIKFADKWKFLFPAIIINGIIFIVWDIWFTSVGIWKFNPDYVI
ncbi:MAG: carotenoid biosynthesis protein, partial [Bacteroidetes bacterium]|nr:carotenoid biosynthesis protein [Bacteroidota bacterium]